MFKKCLPLSLLTSWRVSSKVSQGLVQGCVFFNIFINDSDDDMEERLIKIGEDSQLREKPNILEDRNVIQSCTAESIKSLKIANIIITRNIILVIIEYELTV